MLNAHMRTNQGVATRPVRAFFTGPSRSGKTSTALSFPNPLLVSAKDENGARVADNLPFHVSVVECGGFQAGKSSSGPALMDVVRWASAEARNGTLRRADGSPVGTIIIDSLSHFESMLMSELVGQGKMEQQTWGVLLEAWKAFRAALWALPVHVVLTCLDEVKQSKDGRIIGHTNALKGQIGALLPSECDIIAYTEQEADGVFMAYMCRRGMFTGGGRIPGMPNGAYQNFNFGAHIAPYLGA